MYFGCLANTWGTISDHKFERFVSSIVQKTETDVLFWDCCKRSKFVICWKMCSWTKCVSQWLSSRLLYESMITDHGQVLGFSISINHSIAKANLNKSKFLLASTTTASKLYNVHTQEAKNLHQLKSPLSDLNLLGKSTSKCEHCETRFT